MTPDSAHVLYLSYDGMTDPLGRSQVLPYLVGLAGRGHRIALVSLDKPHLLRRHRHTVDRICRDAGIEWHPLPYRRRPPILSALVNVAALRRTGTRLHRHQPFDLVHCRSDLPGLAGMALKRRFGLRLLYDMRAFWPDERVESGAWDQRRWLYRTLFGWFKSRQRDLIAAADHIVTLSETGRGALGAIGGKVASPVTVIPCCADFVHFAPPLPGRRKALRHDLGLAPAEKLLVHIGSIGGNVMLGEMLDFLTAYRARHASARLLFLTPDDDGSIMAAARERGVGDSIEVRSADREQVPEWIGAADLGLFFVRPSFAKQAASPTKLGEMLAVGLPVVTNAGVGDVADIVTDVGAGVVVDRFDAAAYAAAIETLDGMMLDPIEIRNRALPWFDLQVGTARYDAIYRRLAARPAPLPDTGVAIA